MSRAQGKKENSGDVYSDVEYNYMFFNTIRGIEFSKTAMVLGRTVDEIEACWRRLCYNASDYKYKRTYDLKPMTPRIFAFLNGYAKQYIEIQYTDENISTSIMELAERTGILESRIRKYLKSINCKQHKGDCFT